MTVSTTLNRIAYTGDAVSTVFTFPYKFLANSDIVVYLNGVQATTGFTTAGAGGTSGTVTFSAAPANGVTILLVRIPDYLQSTALPANGVFPSTSVETMSDKAMIAAQRLADLIGRAIVLSDGDSAAVMTLPLLAARAGKFLAFDGSGLPYAATGGGGDSGLRTDLGAAGGVALVNGATRVVDSIAALRLLLKASTARVFVAGYYAAGDGGGGLYYCDTSDTTSTDNSGSVIVAADLGRWKLVNTSTLSVKQFGAKGDGSTDDRVAIQAAINAALTNGNLYVPSTGNTFYSVSKASGSYCLTVTRPLNLLGDGLFSAINPDATATALVDTIYLQPVSGGGFYGMQWDGITIGNPNTGNRNGRHGIYIDTSVVGSNLQKPIFRRLNIMQGNGTLPTAITHTNNGTNNVNGGMYGAEIVDCPLLKGGISLNATGDSNIIQRNIITGAGVGVYASLVTGASLLTIVDNNITTNGGQIRIDAGSRTKILNNNMEQTVATTGQTIMVYLSGLNGTMSMCEVRGNHMGAFTGSNMTANVLIAANVLGTIVEGNTMLNSNVAFTGPCVQLTGGTSNRIGFNQYGTNITTPITDAGTGTMGVNKPLTLLNSWTTQSGFPAPYAFKDVTGTVHLHGELANGTTTPGTVIATLPSAFWPSATQDFPTASANGGTYNVGVFTVNASNGNVTITAGSNGQFGLHASWRAVDASKLSSDV